jgi:hypothetical protein
MCCLLSQDYSLVWSKRSGATRKEETHHTRHVGAERNLPFLTAAFGRLRHQNCPRTRAGEVMRTEIRCSSI